MDQPIVRRAVPSDIPVLARLIASLFELEPDYPVDLPKHEAGIALLLRRDDAAVFCAVDDRGSPVGMASVQSTVSTAEGKSSALVEDVVVDAGCRGRGIGRALMAAISLWCRDRSIDRVQLLVDRGNAPADAFYRSIGFAPTRMVNYRLRLDGK